MKFLIVVDMQNDFITGSLGTKEAEAILPKVLEKIRTYRPEQIFVTQDTHPDNYLETKEGRHLPVAHCIAGSEGCRTAVQMPVHFPCAVSPRQQAAPLLRPSVPP